jgi:hypothetical protein
MENATLARCLQKGVAEQNSVDLCWDLLMDSTLTRYAPPSGGEGSVSVCVNSVMADIMDKDLGTSQQLVVQAFF